MPFHSHHHHSLSGQLPSTAAGLFASAQSLGSVGAPNLTRMASGTTNAGTDAFSSPTSLHAGGQTAPPLTTGLPGPSSSAPVSAPNSAIPQSAQGFDTPRRAQGISRRAEEQAANQGQSMGPYTPQQQYSSQQDYVSGAAPNIHLQQATPQGSQFPASASANVPGALQPGNTSRPGPSAAYTAPSVIPTMPDLPMHHNGQPYAPPPSRSNTLHASHSHSRSSPAGLDHHKYVPFSGTPTATPGSKIFSPQTPTMATSHSPLGLSDIRPRATSDLNTMEGTGPNAIFNYSPVQTNSSYLAPWSTYAYDWCKWPVHDGKSCGKMAIGSYLEDPHNFVSLALARYPLDSTQC